MRKTTFTRTAAAVFGATLLMGAAACSSDDVQDAADKAGDAATQATDAAGSAAEKATDAAGSAAEKATGEAGAEGEEVAEADLPAEVTEAAAANQLGAFSSAQKDGDTIVATYENGHVVSSPDTGAQVLIGKIGETWLNDGGLKNEVGLPTAPEFEIEGGWEQEFTNGKIQWTVDPNGQFSAKYL